MSCYRCPTRAAYRHTALHQPWWRRLLRLRHRVWETCAEHRYDPIAAGHASRMVVVHRDH